MQGLPSVLSGSICIKHASQISQLETGNKSFLMTISLQLLFLHLSSPVQLHSACLNSLTRKDGRPWTMGLEFLTHPFVYPMPISGDVRIVPRGCSPATPVGWAGEGPNFGPGILHFQVKIG